MATGCAETPKPEALIARLSAKDQKLFTKDPNYADWRESIKVARVEMDGPPPLELAFSLARLGEHFDETPSESLVWLFQCAEGRWSTFSRLNYEIDSDWDGTYEGPAGIQVLRAERLPGVGHDFLRIEHVNMRGAYDPRYFQRLMQLVHRVEGQTVLAFDTFVRDETTSGPDRESDSIVLRYVVYGKGETPTIRYREVETNDWGRQKTLCRTLLRFDGKVFRSQDPDCYLERKTPGI